MVIGAARFAIRTTGYVDGIPIQAWVYPRDREAGFADFAQAEKAVRFFHERVGPFPYAKLANVQSKTRYGGMENASNIFYSEGAVRGDLSNEGLIVHEIAHQWFGDSVTELDWNHIWLSEGFATYFTHLFNEANYGRERLVQGLVRDRNIVSGFYSQYPDQALVALQLADPNDMLNRNAYQKGSWVLHMLRRQVGDENFWAGIREYYARYRDGSALTQDLRLVMEEVSGQDLEDFFHQWVFTPGHPKLEGQWSYDTSAGALRLSITQAQGTGTIFRFPLDIGIGSANGSSSLLGTVQIDQATQTFIFPLASPPVDLVLDPDTWLLFEGEVSRGSGQGRMAPGS
jgi:aminopeptidase N